MVEMKVYLSNGLNDKFRRIAMTVYGYGRGSLSKAAEEAFARWCAEHDGTSPKPSLAGISEASTVTEPIGINPDERIGTGAQHGQVRPESTSKIVESNE